MSTYAMFPVDRPPFVGSDLGILSSYKTPKDPTYFFTTYTSKYVLDPGLNDRSVNWVKGQWVHSLLKLILDQDAEFDRGYVIQSKSCALLV